MYLRYINSMVKQHEESMRYSTRRFKEENMRTKLGCYAYHMRCWLRLLRRSWSLSSYPLPMSMHTWGGIDHNNRQDIVVVILLVYDKREKGTWLGNHMTWYYQPRVVWKNLRSRRIGKSLEMEWCQETC